VIYNSPQPTLDVDKPLHTPPSTVIRMIIYRHSNGYSPW